MSHKWMVGLLGLVLCISALAWSKEPERFAEHQALESIEAKAPTCFSIDREQAERWRFCIDVWRIDFNDRHLITASATLERPDKLRYARLGFHPKV